MQDLQLSVSQFLQVVLTKAYDIFSGKQMAASKLGLNYSLERRKVTRSVSAVKHLLKVSEKKHRAFTKPLQLSGQSTGLVNQGSRVQFSPGAVLLQFHPTKCLYCFRTIRMLTIDYLFSFCIVSDAMFLYHVCYFVLYI